MRDKKDIPPFPSIAEFNGFCNIPPYSDDDPTWCSVDNPPEWGGFPEWWPIYQEAGRWFAANVPSPGANDRFYIPERDVFVPWDDADDRTLRVEHIDYSRLSLDLLHRLQREFLGRYPLWRVLMIGFDDSTGIVIYPTVIRFGSLPIEMDPEVALRDVRERGSIQREAHYAPQRAYLAKIRSMLPEAVRAIGDRRFLVFGLLDSWDDRRDLLTVCLLLHTADHSLIIMEAPPECGDQFLYTGGRFGVDARGEIVCDKPIPDDVPFCFSPWLPPADYRGPVFVVEHDTGRRHLYEVKSENIQPVLPAG